MAEITHQVVTNTGGLIIRTPLSMWMDNGGMSKFEVRIDAATVYTVNQNFYNPNEKLIIKIPSDQIPTDSYEISLVGTDITGKTDDYQWFFDNGLDLTSWHYLDYNPEIKANDAAK